MFRFLTRCYRHDKSNNLFYRGLGGFSIKHVCIKKKKKPSRKKYQHKANPSESLPSLAVSQKQVEISLSWNYLNKETGEREGGEGGREKERKKKKKKSPRGDSVMSAVCVKEIYS